MLDSRETAKIALSLIKLKYCEKGIETNYFNTNEKQGQISFLEPETHKIWKIFFKGKEHKIKNANLSPRTLEGPLDVTGPKE